MPKALETLRSLQRVCRIRVSRALAENIWEKDEEMMKFEASPQIRLAAKLVFRLVRAYYSQYSFVHSQGSLSNLL